MRIKAGNQNMMLSSLRLAENLIKLGFKAEGELETVSDRLRPSLGASFQ